MEEIVDLSKDDVTQKPRKGQIRRDKVQWTAMSISFKQITSKTIKFEYYGENLQKG